MLEHLDDRLRRAGYPTVRYGDDLAILATSRDDALEAAGSRRRPRRRSG